MLDINLGDHNSFAIADRLADAGHPVPVRHRLWRAGAYCPSAIAPRTVLQKPYTLQMMARGLPELIAATER